MDNEDLKKHGIKGWRLKLVNILKSKPYDIFMIILIILYSLLIFLFFAFADSYF